ncbi:IS30 family transposase [Salinibacterium sp.]|uniref:IS30 family transposase n=1 Tax=Salinibacterium sp. TaxID=1915057 RepID=UPI00286B2744|nr:IS30 family transposase [Salinibacterium sp.]
MGRRGRKRWLSVEDAYWKLILAGIGPIEAARRIGIARTTGFRWRAERGGVAPLRLVEADRHTRYLSSIERERLAVLRRDGLSMREISRQLGRSPSTISRELHRNMRRHDRGRYDAVLAHARSREKARRARAGRIGQDPVLRDLVQDKLTLDWSPEQISFWLRETHPQKKSWHVCHETIYQAVYWPRNSGLTRKLTTHLRTGRPLRKRRRRPDVRTPRFIVPATLIDHRPAVVEERSRLGDWEGDLIIGSKTRSAIGTLVERKSGYVLLLHLPDTHTAPEVNAALMATMSQLPAHLRHTLTWDQGSEMSGHDKIASLFGDGVFFAHPGKPWQRGSNENMNGLLRQYFPKHSDLSVHTAETLKAVAARLNDRPRKRLNWNTPTLVITTELGSRQETSVATTA